jgi:hypothetical protein
MTYGDIAKRLTLQNVPTYSGLPEWNRETVRAILTNPVYYGKIKWNASMTVKQLVGGQLVKGRKKMKDTEHYMEFEGKHEGLITEEQFKAAQNGEKRDKTKDSFELRNMLAGLLVCQKCQHAMVYYAHRKTPGQKERFHHGRSVMCKVKSVFFSDVIDAFAHGLRMYLDNFQMELESSPDIDEADIQKQIQALQAEKRKVEKILDRVFDEYEAENYTPNEFVKRKAKHNARIEAITKEIEELESVIPQKMEYEEKIIYLHEAIEMLKNDEIPAGVKNTYLKQFVQRIEFSRESDEEFTLDIYLF